MIRFFFCRIQKRILHLGKKGIDSMKNITTRNFRILSDFMEIRQFMVEIYERNWKNGVPAPFLEYALSSDWMDKSFTHRYQIWEEDGTIVAFCFTENPISHIYFSIRPGYESLAEEMVQYSEEYMPRIDGTHTFVLFDGQETAKSAVSKAGYEKSWGYNEMIYDFSKPVDFPLPQGFQFEECGKLNIEKAAECCWKGFDREKDEGSWNGDAENGYHLLAAPHYTPYDVAVKNEAGDYVCYAGMWWTPENKLAYMEPLCTVPEYRNKGLAAAALSEMYRRMKSLGATHMTGGGDPFYAAIGFQP